MQSTDTWREAEKRKENRWQLFLIFSTIAIALGVLTVSLYSVGIWAIEKEMDRSELLLNQQISEEDRREIIRSWGGASPLPGLPGVD